MYGCMAVWRCMALYCCILIAIQCFFLISGGKDPSRQTDRQTPPVYIFFREYQESLVVHRTRDAGHRNERLQLTKSFPEPPERQFQRFERSGGLSGPLRGPTISANPRVAKTETKAVGSTGSTY